MRRCVLVALLFLVVLPASASASVGVKTQKAYNRLWQKTSRFYGARGQPPPLFTAAGPTPYGSSGPGEVIAGPNGVREVSLSPVLSKNLASRDGMLHKNARRNLLHEWAHVYQAPALYGQGRDLPHDQQPMEAGAEGFAGAVNQRLQRRALIRRARKQGNRPRVRALRREPTLPLDTAQFGSNYGADPRTITYPQ